MKPVRVAVDLHVVDRPGMEFTGVGRYAVEATAALACARPEWEIVALTNRTDLLPASVRLLATAWPTERAAVRVAWLQTQAALEIRGLALDAWVGSAFTLPVWCRSPTLVAIHDLIFLTHRSSYSHWLNARYATLATKWAAGHSDGIICGTSATAAQLESVWGVDLDKVSVVPYGVTPQFHDVERHPDPATILYVGTIEPRKGIEHLLDALEAIRRTLPGADLVLAGKKGWNVDSMMDRIAGADGVRHVDAPSDDELVQLYARATVVVLPSFAEGFGLPVAEAIVVGAPVVCSDLPAIRDWAGDVPTYVSAGDSMSLGQAVLDILLRGSSSRRTAGERCGLVQALRWSAVGERWAEQLARILDL
jgi:glycosyltransferase involved in cell wall biosynthesis